MNWYFWLAVLLSLTGPMGYYLISNKAKLARFFDGFVLTAMIGLVALHILPESLERAGVTTLFAVLLGLIGPLIISYFTKKKQCEIQKPFLLISIFGFIAHNMLDGAALVVHPNAHGNTHLLALAVAMHRFIESTAVFNAVAKSFGNVKAWLSVTGLSLAMLFGFFFGEHIFVGMDETILHWLQALACGMIFHILLHPHHLHNEHSHSSKILKQVQSAGALCGLVMAVTAYLFLPTHNHDHEHHYKVESHGQHKS